MTTLKKLNPIDWNDDSAVVVSFLHHTGENRKALTADEQWEVFCLGNGFGDCTPEVLAEINSGWDWSHVRDSDDTGWARMANRVRELVPATARN